MMLGLILYFSAVLRMGHLAVKGEREGKNAGSFAGCDLGRGFVEFGTQLDRKRYQVAVIWQLTGEISCEDYDGVLDNPISRTHTL